MTKKIISIDNATIDAEKLRDYNSEIRAALQEKEDAEAAFKDIVDRVAKETKLKKTVVAGYFKARFKATTKDTVKKGGLFEALDSALDD